MVKKSDNMKIFINLPVKDLNKTIEFFTKLGFRFNPQFTDKNATCMIINENIFVMLLIEKFFKTFIKKDIANTSNSAETILALSTDSKEKVNEMIKKVIAAGGKESREPQDYGWMYGRAFEDINGHIWEIFYMNEKQMPKEMKEKK